MRSGPETCSSLGVTPIIGQCGPRGRSRRPDSLRRRSSSRSVNDAFEVESHAAVLVDTAATEILGYVERGSPA